MMATGTGARRSSPTSTSTNEDVRWDDDVKVEARHDATQDPHEVDEIGVYGTPLTSLRAITSLDAFTRLRRLRAHGCGLRAMDTHALRHCKELEELNLSSNDITVIEGLGVLKSLKVLNLACNAITSTRGMSEAPTSLDKVNLSNNKISSLNGLCRDDGMEWGIRVLDVRGNTIVSFQEVRALSELTRLESLLLRVRDSSVVGEETNTLCDTATYRLTIASLVPWLDNLDGVVVSIETSTKAMTKTLGGNAQKTPETVGRMTPPIAEHISRTPKKTKRRQNSSQTVLTDVVPSDTSPEPAEEGSDAARSSAVPVKGVRLVRDESCQTESFQSSPESSSAEAQTQTDDAASEEASRKRSAEQEVLHKDLISARRALEMSTDAERVANRRIDELQSTLRDVRIESAENLAQLKSMYADEHNIMTAARTMEASKMSMEKQEVADENARLKQSIQSLEAQIARNAADFDEQLKTSKSEITNMRERYAEIAAAYAESEALNEELAQVVESQRAHLTEFAKTRELLKVLEEELQVVRKTAEDREDTHKTITGVKIAAEKAEDAAIKREARARDRELVAEKLIRDVEALQSRLEAANENTLVRDDVIQHQSQLIKSLKAEAIRLNKEKTSSIDAAQMQATHSENKARAMMEECNSLMEQVETLEMRTSELESALEEVDIDRSSYEHALNKASVAINERDVMIEHLEAQLNRVASTLDTRDRIENARSAELAQQVNDLQHELHAATEEARACESRVKAIREESHADIREAYARVDDVENEMRGLLLDMAEERRANRERLDRIGSLLNIPVSSGEWYNR